MPTLQASGGDDARRVGADEPGLGALQRAPHAHHVEHRNALGNADHQRNLRGNGFQHGIRGAHRRHIDDADLGTGSLHRLVHAIENRQVKMFAAALARRHAGHQAGAIGNSALAMKGALGAGNALANHLGIAVDEYGHLSVQARAAATAFSAASRRLSAGVNWTPMSRRVFLPRSRLVPSKRTTSGTLRPSA